MTHIEALELIRNRVEWKAPFGTDFSFVTFKTPESGRYLQEEHTGVNLNVISETVFDLEISNEDFEKSLEYLKEKAILQMLHDVFFNEKDICENKISSFINLFDYAIILKLTSNVLFDILNTTRINLIKHVTQENLKRWFIDLNGLKDTENGVYKQGYVDRYKREVERIRKVLFIKKNRFKVLTAR